MPRLGSLTQSPRAITRFGANVVPMCGHGFIVRQVDGEAGGANMAYRPGLRLRGNIGIGHAGFFAYQLKAPTFTDRFSFSGTTADRNGSVVGSALVRVMLDGALPTLSAETVSDAGGAWSVNVPTNGGYQVNAFKDGVPDLAGVSDRPISPRTGLTIYMRDPTTADPAAAGAGVSRARVVNGA